MRDTASVRVEALKLFNLIVEKSVRTRPDMSIRLEEIENMSL